MDKEETIADMTTVVVSGVSTACKQLKLPAIDAIRIMANSFWTMVLTQSNVDDMPHNISCAAEIIESGKRAAIAKAEDLAFDKRAKSKPVGNA